MSLYSTYTCYATPHFTHSSAGPHFSAIVAALILRKQARGLHAPCNSKQPHVPLCAECTRQNFLSVIVARKVRAWFGCFELHNDAARRHCVGKLVARCLRRALLPLQAQTLFLVPMQQPEPSARLTPLAQAKCGLRTRPCECAKADSI